MRATFPLNSGGILHPWRMEGALPFGFAVPLLVPLAQRALELLGDPLGALHQEVEHLPASYPIEVLQVTTWTDSRGHRLVQRHEQDFKEPLESYDRRCDVWLEGIHGQTTIVLNSPPFIDELRFYKIDSPDDATARECLRALTIALIERAHDGRLVGGFELPSELVARSRHQLQAAAAFPPTQHEPRLLVFPPMEMPSQSGIQYRGDIGSWFELNILGPLPRTVETIEAICRLQPAGLAATAPRPTAAMIAQVLLGGQPKHPWRLQVTDQPRGPQRTLFAMRLQHEGGDGPAAFVQWQLADERLGQREGLDALLIGTVPQVRAAVERLVDQLALNEWKPAPSKLASGEQWL